MIIAGVGVGEAFGCDYCRRVGGGGEHLDVTIAGVGVGEVFGCDYCRSGGGDIWM